MTLKEFMASNNVTGFEVVPDVLILNAMVNGSTPYGLDVDTSTLVGGTKLSLVTDFSINNDILTVGNLSLNTNTTNLLGLE